MKKTSKTLSILVACVSLLGTLTACGGTANSSSSKVESTTAASSEAGNKLLTEAGLDENLKFTETRKITVEVYDRGNDGGSAPEDNYYTKFIKEGMLRDHNVEVEFVPVGRWTEVDEINNLLASGKAPDICVTYDYPTIQTYASMGGVLDMAPYVDDYKEILPDIWDLLTETNMYYQKDPNEGTIWAIKALMKHNLRINTFVREDWMTKLGIKEPTTIEEFEAMLKSFKENASTLLGAEADKIVPFSLSFDVGWRAEHMLSSFVPDKVTEEELYVNNFDDRHLLYPNYKAGVKKLNEWYNAGLIWKDFALYPSGDKTEDNMIKAGYVGSFTHNWDYPYRNGDDSIQANLKRLVGEDAAFIAVEPFKNDAGKYKKFLAGPVDRNLFFPNTNDEPVASMLYLNWISKLENRSYLQIGDEGATHEKQADGSVKTLAATGEKIMNSPSNIDYTLTINGLDLGDTELNIKSMALGYAGIDAKYIEKAYKITQNEGYILPNINVGAIEAEQGMGPALSEKRNVLLDQSVVAPANQFDSVYDGAMKDYLASGGQAIIDERTQKYADYKK